VSDHRLNIDVQKIAIAVQAIRAQLDILEDIIEQALLKENENE
jgi:hypothetical protein